MVDLGDLQGPGLRIIPDLFRVGRAWPEHERPNAEEGRYSGQGKPLPACGQRC